MAVDNGQSPSKYDDTVHDDTLGFADSRYVQTKHINEPPVNMFERH